MESLYVFWMWALSFRKNDWEFDDYPIRVTEVTNPEPGQPKYFARILRWFLTGVGETDTSAKEDLRFNFEKFKRNRPDDVKRPGVQMPLEFASTEGIERFDAIAEKFIDEVLGFGPGDPVFISDESSLLDFTATDEEMTDFSSRTKDVFGVDISDITDGNLVKIFERIDNLGTNR